MEEDKKYLIFSPINEYGGVNIEVSFIANLINEKNPVEVISLGDYYSNALGNLNSNVNYNSLDRIIYNQHSLIRSITDLICKVKPLSSPNHFRVENKLTTSSLIKVRNKKIKVIEKAISRSDVVVICSQLTAHFVKEIVQFAFQQDKKIIFRLTGQIQSQHLKKENIPWFRKVSTFIHHSSKSQERLSNFLKNSNNVIIDQTTILEKELLQIKIKPKKVNKFFTLSRLHSLKNIDAVIKAFINQSEGDDELNIYGDGEELIFLKKLAQNQPNIFFKGKVEFKDVPRVFEKNDCLIISSSSEAGPLVAIEAMAAGVLIITADIGAMKDRLPKYKFLYKKYYLGLTQAITSVKKLNSLQVQKFSIEFRTRYLENYSLSSITALYKKVL